MCRRFIDVLLFFKKHIAQQCTFKLHQPDSVVESYDGLTVDEKAKVRDTLYNNSRFYLETTNSYADETATEEETDLKNRGLC